MLKQQTTIKTFLWVVTPVLTAGLASNVWAQGNAQNNKRNTDRPVHSENDRYRTNDRMNQQASSQNLNFIEYDEATGMDILSVSEEKLGEVNDFIVEQGSGKIAYVLVGHGGALGIGETETAVPYQAFNITRRSATGSGVDNIELRLPMTKTELENAPEFDKNEWPTLKAADWNKSESEYWSDFVDFWTADDEPQEMSQAMRGEPTTIEGTIVDIRRTQNQNNVETTTLVVETDDNTQRIVHLGPSWWVMTQEHTPQRSEQVTLTGYQLNKAMRDTNRDMDRNNRNTRLNETAFVATTVEFEDGEKITLRDPNRGTAWTSRPATANARYVLASDLINADVRTADQRDAGHIDALFIECTNGQLAFVGVDPDQAFADLGDVNRIVPFETIAFRRDGNVQLTTSMTTLRNSVETPEDTMRLNERAFRTNIYNQYDITERSFERNRIHGNQDSSWDERGYQNRDAQNRNQSQRQMNQQQYMNAIQSGQKQTLTGKIVRVQRDAAADRYLGDTKIVLNTTEGQRTICLAPRAFLNEKAINLDEDDFVTVETVRTTVDGQTKYIATSLTVDGEQYQLRKQSGTPVWNTQ